MTEQPIYIPQVGDKLSDWIGRPDIYIQQEIYTLESEWIDIDIDDIGIYDDTIIGVEILHRDTESFRVEISICNLIAISGRIIMNSVEAYNEMA
jgi:hypothetical protein